MNQVGAGESMHWQPTPGNRHPHDAPWLGHVDLHWQTRGSGRAMSSSDVNWQYLQPQESHMVHSTAGGTINLNLSHRCRVALFFYQRSKHSPNLPHTLLMNRPATNLGLTVANGQPFVHDTVRRYRPTRRDSRGDLKVSGSTLAVDVGSPARKSKAPGAAADPSKAVSPLGHQ